MGIAEGLGMEREAGDVAGSGGLGWKGGPQRGRKTRESLVQRAGIKGEMGPGAGSWAWAARLG